MKCAFCDVVISDWDETDVPLTEHIKHSRGRCPLLNRSRTQNIPLDEADLNRNLPEVTPDECSGYGCEYHPPKQSDYYVHPEYVLEVNRMKTFSTWPKSIRQRPEELVETGFFYTGQGDLVFCFSCGLGLRDWEIDDVPSDEHAKYTTDCIFLNLVKGPEYIANVKEAQLKDDLSKRTVARSFSHMGQEQHEISLENACKICLDKNADILFQPCNHCASCGSCSVSLKTCPVCRKPIATKTKIFFS